jgi:16S rRNA (cytosine1402-N4)-methyltransferase
MQSVHQSVLLNETTDGLNLKPNSVVLDATFGGGGHSLEILRKFPEAKIIALDQDKNAWRENDSRISFHNQNFGDLDQVLKSEKVDGIIFDLGLSSDQLENSGRGFSFQKNEPLIMQMKNSGKENPDPEDVTAMDVVNTWEEKNLADIIYGYGEERYARRIARGIVEARAQTKIKTTFDLVKIISEAVPAVYRRGRLHFATRTFQAIRIAVNDELRVLQKGLEQGFEKLKVGGRMSVITFHSLEDRIVKKFFKARQNEDKAILIPARPHESSGAGGNKKIILASSAEIKKNPRSRSAKLRILEKTQE